jgi:hypothetical protein
MLSKSLPTRPPQSVCTVALALALLCALPAAAQADWGAIAVDGETGRTAVAYDYATATDARERAREECGGGCQAAVWVRDGYAALVQKRNGTFVGGVGETRELAFRKARQRAHEQRTRPVVWVFSG